VFVLQNSTGSPTNWIEIKSDGSIRTPLSNSDLVPAGKKLIVQDVEYTIRGPAAYANKRVYISIHLGALGQSTASFRTSMVLDANAEGSGAHYMTTGFSVVSGEGIGISSFVYPNNQSGNANINATLRGVLVLPNA
jgi:hypothetical protein